MAQFNRGNPYHGSAAVEDGKLRGTMDTDYFYFFCPKCPDEQIMRVLDYGVHESQPDNPYDGLEGITSRATKGFTLAFKIHCEECGLTDFVKVSNLGWQGGLYRELAV